MPAREAGGGIVARGTGAPGGLVGTSDAPLDGKNESVEADGLKLGGAALLGRDGALLLWKIESASETAEGGPRTPLGEVEPLLKTLSASSAALFARMVGTSPCATP